MVEAYIQFHRRPTMALNSTAPANASVPGKSFGTPDKEIRRFGERGQLEMITIGNTTAIRATFQPGFRWTTDVKPIVGTDVCQVRHVGYVVAGQSRIRLHNGTEFDLKAGDVFDVPPGHDAWTLGDEAYVSIDFTPGGDGQSMPITPPEHHTVLLDNEHVRVLDVRIPPGSTSGRHSHPKSVVYQLTETRVRMSGPDGSGREMELKPGQITWTPGGEHIVENIGPNDDWGIIVELKR